MKLILAMRPHHFSYILVMYRVPAQGMRHKPFVYHSSLAHVGNALALIWVMGMHGKGELCNPISHDALAHILVV